MTILSQAPEIDAKIINGAATINILKPTYCKTFRDYANNTFMPYISSLLKHVELVDMIHMGEILCRESERLCERKTWSWVP